MVLGGLLGFKVSSAWDFHSAWFSLWRVFQATYKTLIKGKGDWAIWEGRVLMDSVIL